MYKHAIKKRQENTQVMHPVAINVNYRKTSCAKIRISLTVIVFAQAMEQNTRNMNTHGYKNTGTANFPV